VSILYGHAERWEENDHAIMSTRLNVRNLLTQRAIQSFLFLLEQCRDPHSVKWIEDFLQATPNQLRYHGTGAPYVVAPPSLTKKDIKDAVEDDDEKPFKFDGSWDDPLLQMLEQPKEVMIVSAKRRGRGQGGWSKNNPYLEERYVEFEIDINPTSLTSRIVSVREQIAKEWIHDLQIIQVANSQIMTSYFEKLRSSREKATDPTTSTPDEELWDMVPDLAFDRMAMNILNNNASFTAETTMSSPLRKASFDLLYNLCTQASIHRLLHQLADQSTATNDDRVAFVWLRNFYTSRVGEYFDGDQKYGRADDFLEDLLTTSPRVIQYSSKDSEDNEFGYNFGGTVSDGDVLGLADPIGLAEQIINIRSLIVEEWKSLMEQVPSDHSEIRRRLLEKQTGDWSNLGTSTSPSTETSRSTDSSNFESENAFQ